LQWRAQTHLASEVRAFELVAVEDSYGHLSTI
jgi:hypothetical protein